MPGNTGHRIKNVVMKVEKIDAIAFVVTGVALWRRHTHRFPANRVDYQIKVGLGLGLELRAVVHVRDELAGRFVRALTAAGDQAQRAEHRERGRRKGAARAGDSNPESFRAVLWGVIATWSMKRVLSPPARFVPWKVMVWLPSVTVKLEVASGV